ncbi:MAG: hypothetical protein ACKOWL_06200 [Sphingobacteriaceae bacterium]
MKCVAQHSHEAVLVSHLPAFQDSLLSLSKQFINQEIEPERYNANYKFIKTLVEALKEPKSFYFDFDSLKTISIVTSPDKKFRIFTWHVLNDDGSYRFYGTIQLNTSDGRLKLFPLSDYSAFIQNPGNQELKTDEWFAAQYYQVVGVNQNTANPYYILLGWKGNSNSTTKKVIDALHFVDGIPYFGLSVFDGNSQYQGNKRIIFDYAREASMYLKYDYTKERIVFDHLAPTNSALKNDFSKYGPDMTYDAFQLSKGRWKYQSNLLLNNPPSEKDDLFNDPKKLKQNTQPIRKY